MDNIKDKIIPIIQFLVIFAILFVFNSLGNQNRTNLPTNVSNSTVTRPAVQRPVEQPRNVTPPQRMIEQSLPKEEHLINSRAPFDEVHSSDVKKEQFIKHFYAGRASYRNDDYGTALKEFNLAKQIYPKDTYVYYYLAMIHRDMDRYDEGIEAAKTGLMYDEADSYYAKAKGYIIDNNVHYWEYKVLGDCYRYDGRYEEAIKAYSVVIDNNQVKYRDIYLRRGKCYYYLNNMDSARKDFENHRLVINKYLSKQANKQPANRDKNPKYDRSDLVELDEWINKTYE